MLQTIRRSVQLALLVTLVGASPALADVVQLSVSSTGLAPALSLVPAGRSLGCNGTRCKYEFERGTTVTVTAQPKAPVTFARWFGACSGTALTCSVFMGQSTSLTARFSPVALFTGRQTQYDGGVSVNPPAKSCGLGCRSYPYAARVTVAAQPAPNHAVTSWFGPQCGAVTGNVCTVSLFDNTDAVPEFVCTSDNEDDCINETSDPIERYVGVSVTVVGGGSVQVAGKTCTRPKPCSLSIKRGTLLALRADSNGPSRFARWDGACTGTSQRCQTTAFRDARGKLPAVVAKFT